MANWKRKDFKVDETLMLKDQLTGCQNLEQWGEISQT